MLVIGYAERAVMRTIIAGFGPVPAKCAPDVRTQTPVHRSLTQIPNAVSISAP
jgi:hypothetical protein